MTTAPAPLKMPENAYRAVAPCDLGSKRPYGFLNFFTNWEDYCSKPHWGPGSNIPTIDATIAQKYPNCLLWGLGTYPIGKEPIIGEHPKWPGFDGYTVRCSPCGLEMFNLVNRAYPGFQEVFGARNEVSEKISGKGSMLYVGGLPIDIFGATSWTKAKDDICDILLAPVIKAKFRYLGLDASAACRQKKDVVPRDGVTPTMWLAERALTLGLIPVIEAIPITHPELFPWANGRFANLCTWPEIENGVSAGKGYFNDNCPGCFTERFALYTGSIEQTLRIRTAYRRSTIETPIVDFGDAPKSVWDKGF